MIGLVRIVLVVQTVQASVAGEVRNAETGEPLAGAVVTLTDLRRTTATDQNGHYRFNDVPSGVQPLAARYLGHRPHDVRVLVPVRGKVEINLLMMPVPVRLASIQIRSDQGGRDFPDRVSTIDGVKNHPLLAEPDVFLAMGGGEVVMAPESPMGIHIRGGSSDQTGYTVDGIPVFNPFHSSGTFGALNPDAIADVSISSAIPSEMAGSTLSGAVSASTRTPGTIHSAGGSFSATQTRATVDGPLVLGGGYLLSVRSAFPGFVAPDNERSYVQADIGDWLAKIEAPFAGGRLLLLGFEGEDEIHAAAQVGDPNAGSVGVRNNFDWRSRSLGAQWLRSLSNTTFRVVTWSAVGNAGASWNAGAADAFDLTASRADVGMHAALEHRSDRTTTRAGVRFERTTTAYLSTARHAANRFELHSQSPITSLYGQTEVVIGTATSIDVGSSVAFGFGQSYQAPRARIRWKPSGNLTFSGAIARTHQFVQSLKNPESIVGLMFPVDLYVGAGDQSVPVARSDQIVAAADYRPSTTTHIGVQVYGRELDNLLLPAVTATGPFATGLTPVGSGTVVGGALDVSKTTDRYSAVLGYGYQRVRLFHDRASYIPSYGAPHRFDGGVTFFPAETSSIRIGASGVLGRRTTPVAGQVEWEACSLGDRGCEFAGSPGTDLTRLGARTLPLYARFDIGARKEWSISIGNRPAHLALFGTVTNVLGRANVLTYVSEVGVEGSGAVEMRPRTPLVVGIDWRF